MLVSRNADEILTASRNRFVVGRGTKMFSEITSLAEMNWPRQMRPWLHEESPQSS